jgi:hypothetical protein
VPDRASHADRARSDNASLPAKARGHRRSRRGSARDRGGDVRKPADEIARKRAEKESKEQAERDARLLADLRTNRPDLAELVDENRLPLEEALRLRAADREKERKREAAKAEKIRQRNLDFSLIFAGIGQLEHREIFEEIRDNYHPIAQPITSATFRDSAALLLSLADDWTPSK